MRRAKVRRQTDLLGLVFRRNLPLPVTATSLGHGAKKPRDKRRRKGATSQGVRVRGQQGTPAQAGHCGHHAYREVIERADDVVGACTHRTFGVPAARLVESLLASAGGRARTNGLARANRGGEDWANGIEWDGVATIRNIVG